MTLKGKVAIVTGAGGGVGSATSKKLAENGSKLVMVGRHREKLTKVMSEIGGDKKNLLAIKADITREAEVLNVIEQTISVFDRIDILVNNAGIVNDPISFHLMSDDEWSTLINTNIIGTLRPTKAVLPIMMERQQGCIVNVSSILGLRAIPKVPFSMYGLTKAAVIMFTKSIAVEYGQYNIRSNCVVLSTIRGPAIDPYFQDENAKRVLESSFPLRRIGEPEDIAGAVNYLCSDDAKWVTGSVLTVDGGISARQ